MTYTLNIDGVSCDVDPAEFRRASDADATIKIYQAERAKGIEWGEPLQAPTVHADEVRASRIFPRPDIT